MERLTTTATATPATKKLVAEDQREDDANSDSLVLDLDEYDFDVDANSYAENNNTNRNSVTAVDDPRHAGEAGRTSLKRQAGDDDDGASSLKPTAKRIRTETGDTDEAFYEESGNTEVEVVEDDEDDDDDEDSVNVIIDIEPRRQEDEDSLEARRLARVLADDPYRMNEIAAATRTAKRKSRSRCDYPSFSSSSSSSALSLPTTNGAVTPLSATAAAASQPPPYVAEMQLKNEIMNLVATSVRSSYSRSVTLLVENKLVAIPDHVPLSDQLAARIWPPDKLYSESKLPYVELFNSLLIPNARRNGDTYAVFSVKYNRAKCALRPNSSETRSTRLVEEMASGFHGHHDSAAVSLTARTNGGDASADSQAVDRSSVTALYQFCDFAAVIVSDNKVVDYAVHGVRSSIVRMLDAHRPRRVYYNATIGDPLYVFVNYKYQPFYAALKGISRPVKINRSHANFNTIAFCERNDVFCALCCCLRDVKGFVNDADVPNTLRVPRPIKFISWLPYDPYQRTSLAVMRSRAMSAVCRRKRQQQHQQRRRKRYSVSATSDRDNRSRMGHSDHDVDSDGDDYRASLDTNAAHRDDGHVLDRATADVLIGSNGQLSLTSASARRRKAAAAAAASMATAVDDPFRQPELLPRRIPSRFPRSAPQRYRSAKEMLRDRRRGDFRPLVRTSRRKR